MALITRISRLFTADVHAVLDRIEEPQAVLQQAIREMTEELAQGERQLRWFNTEGQQLQQRLSDLSDQIAALEGELDLCFAAEEEDLARSLIKRKLVAEQSRSQASQQLDNIDREHKALSSLLVEQRQSLADTRQKADFLVDVPPTGRNSTIPADASGISQDVIEVAFLKEKQRRQS